MTEAQLDQYVKDFIQDYKIEGCTKLCLDKSSLMEAIEAAILSEDNNEKVDSHQRRVGRTKLKLYSNKLIGEKYSEIEGCRSFDELYAIIKSCHMAGIGELTTYDIAVRIANYLNGNLGNSNIMPDKVYLHTGAWVGAKKLLGTNRRLKRIMPRSSFPPPLRDSKLDCDEIESFLCVMKDVLEPYAGHW